MAHDWTAPTDSGTFEALFASDPADDFLPPHYYDGFIPTLSDSWLSTAMANDIDLPDPSFLQFDGGVDVTWNDMNDNDAFPELDQIDPFLESLSLDGPSSNLGSLEWNQQILSDSMHGQIPDLMETTIADYERDTIISRALVVKAQELNGSQSSSLGPSDVHKSTKRSASNTAKPPRTKLPEDVRATLDEYFGFNPYPSESEYALLSDKTGLSTRVIRTWFANARSRKIPQSKKS
ncbi:hypothetical protein AA0113_g8267 [Alternaria arborescens]|uniref:Homeobox domain-containing protein n=1 Tax=Alternaria arborescens TaxID=156630 RepID=A0A4V1X3S0_9PLEO|nr:hypothetical protein AA0111_g6564 [Alternaria arborescens]RYO28549.1 hypothetical protein AA0111_g6564 [Alternaria arborescens]RYO56958.1 hypothetical protein AA0113_g8267 [Alternaria arborescens]